MLTSDEKDYLAKISKNKKVIIKPFNPLALSVVQQITNQVHQIDKNIKVIHMGASALKISGQKDLDIYTLTKSKNFSKYLSKLIKIFGTPKNQKYDSIAWKFNKQGYEIEFYLTDPKSEPMRRQIAVFNILKKNKKLLKEYERLKEKFNGKSFVEYQKKKYEFYHKILDKKS